MNDDLIYEDNPPTYVYEDEQTRELTPGQLKLIEDMKDAKDFYLNNTKAALEEEKKEKTAKSKEK